MGRKLCGKRKNCSLRAISLFPQYFQKTCTADTQKPGLVWERIKKNPSFFPTEYFEVIEGKEGNASNNHCLLFLSLKIFLPFQRQKTYLDPQSVYRLQIY